MKGTDMIEFHLMGRDEPSRLVYSTEHTVPRRDAVGARDSSNATPQAGQQVRVGLEKKGRGGKSVSVISGLALPQKEMEPLLKRLKTGLGTGGAIKDNTIEIQGDHRDRIINMLSGMGYKPKKAGG
jgi:translation initiation factor 1